VIAKYSLRSILHYSNPEDSIESVQMRRRQAAAIRRRKEEEAEVAEIRGARKKRMPVVLPGHLP